MDSVEDKGEDQRQDEGDPASQEKVADRNMLSPDVQISASHNWEKYLRSYFYKLINNVLT